MELGLGLRYSLFRLARCGSIAQGDQGQVRQFWRTHRRRSKHVLMASRNAPWLTRAKAPISPAMIRSALRVGKFLGFCGIPPWIKSDELRIMRCHSFTVADVFKYSVAGVGESEPCQTVRGPHLFFDPSRERALPVPSCLRVADGQSNALRVVPLAAPPTGADRHRPRRLGHPHRVYRES
jgi:hypothetical protein